MKSINKVLLVGHLAANPDLSRTHAGVSRVTFTVATHREFTSDGAKKDVTDYHRVSAVGRLAVMCAKYLSKGQGIYVEGTILNRAYEHNGERKYVTEIRAEEVNMLTWKTQGDVSTWGLRKPATL
jgi:single-strand DNA-binding protein